MVFDAAPLSTLCPSGVLSDDAQGIYASDKIYSDLDIKMLESLPPSAPHREVDLAIVSASDQGTYP